MLPLGFKGKLGCGCCGTYLLNRVTGRKRRKRRTERIVVRATKRSERNKWKRNLSRED